MIVGYARTSTREQVAGFEAQIVELEKVGCEKIFQEQVSAIKEREQLKAALDFVRSGDVFVVTKLDRLARSLPHLVQIVDTLKRKGVTLRVLAINLDTATPTGKLMLNMLGSIAEFERELMLERQRDGIAAAKRDGKYKGRAPTARAKSARIIELAQQGMKREDIANTVGVGVASVYRALKEASISQLAS